MSKADEQYKWRREGMLYAHKKASEVGLDGLKEEIVKRGLLKLDITVTEEDINNAFFNLHENVASTVVPLMLSMLEDDFGFNEEQLKKAYIGYENKWKSVMDLDLVGEHYVTFADYCADFNERYNFTLDEVNAKKCQLNGDRYDRDYHKVDVKSLIASMERDGYPAAAQYLKKKIS